MSTRKSARKRAQRREEERAAEEKRAAERKALEEAQDTSAQSQDASAPPERRRRLTQLGIVGLVVVVAIAAILLATSGSGGTKKITSNSPEANEAVTVVNSELAGVSQHGNTIGDPNAPVTLQYFGDLECPVCKQFTIGVLPTIIEKWVRTGELRIEYHSMETATHEPKVFELQQVAALSAGKQNKMWDYLELFYQEQGEEGTGYVTGGYLQNLARQVPSLNLKRWASDINEPVFIDQLEKDRKTAKRFDLPGTPSFLLGLTGGTAKELITASLTEPTPFDDAIEHLLKTRKS